MSAPFFQLLKLFALLLSSTSYTIMYEYARSASLTPAAEYGCLGTELDAKYPISLVSKERRIHRGQGDERGRSGNRENTEREGFYHSRRPYPRPFLSRNRTFSEKGGHARPLYSDMQEPAVLIINTGNSIPH